MADDSKCLKCGAPLTRDARDAVCPKCLLEQALLVIPPSGGETTGEPADLPAEALAQAGAETPIAAFVPLVESPGTVIGRYTLLEKLGEGGCGIVYMARQEEPVHRRVALKVIKLGMDTKEVIARFEAERQALALMDHPHIAKVFDAGATETGRPFFVMELVCGVRITNYSDQHNLSTRERLELFSKVCHAVQHAHQKGIIHRDIKPSNVLVTSHDGVPVPKVIDFGIAKATAGRLTETTLFTPVGRFIGTAAYMSPEQAELRGLDIDTRTDIYSLGVLLYELLTGHPPFDPKELAQAGLDEIRRIIREVEPPRPSTRLSTMQGLEQLTVARHQQTEPPKLVSFVRGDLDWIVMKCLEKDRAHRYETANSLALDIGHHLNHEPVTAAAPSAAYRLRKFVRRHRSPLVVAAGMVLLLLAGVVVSTWQAVRATRAERFALAEAEANDQVVRFLGEMLSGVQADVALGRDTALLRGIVDKASERIDAEMKGSSRAKASLLNSLGATYNALGDYAKAEVMLRQALAIERTMHGAEHPHVARSLGSVGVVLLTQGKPAEAEAMLRQALAMHRRLRAPEDAEFVNILNGLGATLLEQGKLGEAEMLSRRQLGLVKRLCAPQDKEMATSLNNLARVLVSQGNLTEAKPLLDQAIAIRKELFGDLHPDTAQSLGNIGAVLANQGKLDEAEPLLVQALDMLKRMLGDEHPEVAKGLDNLGALRGNQGRLPEAEALLVQAMDIRKKQLGEENPAIAESLHNIGLVRAKQRRMAEAELLFTQSLAMRERLLGSEHVEVALSLIAYAGILVDRVEPEKAEPILRRALAIREKVLGPESRDVSESLNLLGAVLNQQGKLNEAEPLYRRALDLEQNLSGPESQEVAERSHALCVVLLKQRKLKEAETRIGDLLALRKKLRGNEHTDVAVTLEMMADLRRSQGRFDQTAILWREALAMRQKLQGAEHREVVASQIGLALRLAEMGNTTEALASAREAVAILKKLPDKDVYVVEHLIELAGLFSRLGKGNETEMTYRVALAVSKSLFANGHLQVARILGGLAGAVADQGNLDEAESLHLEALDMKIKLLGREDIQVAGSLNDLAMILTSQGKLDEAERRHLEALAIRRKLGHPSVASSLYLLGEILMRQNKLSDAELLLREAVLIRQNSLGRQHSDVAGPLSTLGGTLRLQGKLEEAEVALIEALAIQRQVGTNSPGSLVIVIWNLAGILAQEGKFAEAEPLLLERYELLLQSDQTPAMTIRDAIETQWKFYTEWSVAAPGTGKIQKAIEWRKKLTEFDQASERKNSSEPK